MVVIHDLTHQHRVVQQIREAGRIEENGQVGHGPLLFHGAHPLAEQRVLLFLLSLKGVNLGLLFRNQGIVLAEHRFSLGDLLVEQRDLLIQIFLLLESLALVVLNPRQLILEIVDLAGNLVNAVFHFVDVRLGHRTGGTRTRPRQKQRQG